MPNVLAELEARTPGSREMHEKSVRVLAQEVVSTVQMPYPVYIREAKGSRMTDVDGNEYIDLAMGFGPHVLGHAPDVVVDALREAIGRGVQWGLHNPYQEPLASLMVDAIPCADKVVFCNTGTEASIYAIRAARAFSGKKKIALFEGAYHGTHDYVMVKADPRSPKHAPTFYPMGDGIPEEAQENTIMLPYRSDAAFGMIRKHKDELALVMIEPVQGSNPRLDIGDFLKQIAEVCRESGVLFLMDEVITGFRLAYGGGQEFFDAVPDLAMFGKVSGGGMPMGAVAGRADVMEVFSRQFDIYNDQGTREPSIAAGGTFAGNPTTMAAGLAAMSYLKDHKEIYRYLAEQGTRLGDEVNRFCAAEEMPAQMSSALSMFYVRVQPGGPIQTARDIDVSMKSVDDMFALHLMNHGVILPPYHLGYISAAHTPEDVDQVIDAMKQSFLDTRADGLL